MNHWKKTFSASMWNQTARDRKNRKQWTLNKLQKSANLNVYHVYHGLNLTEPSSAVWSCVYAMMATQCSHTRVNTKLMLANGTISSLTERPSEISHTQTNKQMNDHSCYWTLNWAVITSQCLLVLVSTVLEKKQREVQVSGTNFNYPTVRRRGGGRTTTTVWVVRTSCFCLCISAQPELNYLHSINWWSKVDYRGDRQRKWTRATFAFLLFCFFAKNHCHFAQINLPNYLWWYLVCATSFDRKQFPVIMSSRQGLWFIHHAPGLCFYKEKITVDVLLEVE